MTSEPDEIQIYKTGEVAAALRPQDEEGNTEVTSQLAPEVSWDRLSSYHRWIIQLYAGDMIERFGGLTVVDKGLLPTGMVGMFREQRIKWQG
jgi:hypothetical protein